MARIRNIKPQFFRNEDLADLSTLTRLFFIGLWTLADRRGRLEDRPRRIKAELFPYDEVDADKCLAELQTAGFLLRYKHTLGTGEVQNLIQVHNFEKHQRFSGDEASRESEYPAPIFVETATTPAGRSKGEATPKQAPLTKEAHTLPDLMTPDRLDIGPNISPGYPASATEEPPAQPSRPPTNKGGPRSASEREAFAALWRETVDKTGIAYSPTHRRTQSKYGWQLAALAVEQFGPADAVAGITTMAQTFARIREDDRSAKGFWRTLPLSPMSLATSSTWEKVLMVVRGDPSKLSEGAAQFLASFDRRAEP